MWKTPSKSPSTTLPLSEAPGSARSELFIDQPIQFPNIIENNPEYLRLYEKIYRSQEKAFESITEQEQNDELKNVKQTITNKLLQEAKQKSFYKKFGRAISSANNSRKILKNAHRSLIGVTKQEENNQKLIDFLIDHRKAVELQEQARLVEYHLMDQEKIKTKIDYINRTQLTDKHRRTDPHSKDRQSKLFKINNQMNYHLIRKTAYIRNDKLMSQSLASAKNNPTYCRMKNFSQIQYILNEDHRNLMITREIPKDAEKEIRYNKQRRLFLSLALASDSIRTYYEYIRQKQFHKIVDLIVPESEIEQQNTKITKQYLLTLIRKLIKYKQLKVIHFEDFIQILTTIKEERNYDLLQKLEEKGGAKKKLLHSDLDHLIETNRSHINGILKSSKFDVVVRKIYEMQSSKIIGRQYLPLREILEIMKSISIVPKVVTMSKFMFNSYWHQRRREGYNFEQFIQVQIAIGMELSGLAGLEAYFRLFDVKQILPN